MKKFNNFNILFINPSTSPFYKDKKKNENDLYINWPTSDFPLGILHLAGYLERKGFIIKILDMNKLSKDKAIKFLTNYLKKISLVGFSVMTSSIPSAIELSDFIKTNFPNIYVVWGGIHPTLYPIQTIKDSSIDYVITGKGEKGLERLCHYLKNNDIGRVRDIPCVYSKGNFNPIENPKTNNNTLEYYEPAYHLLDLKKYFYVKDNNNNIKKTIEIITSRGCPYKCNFCVNSILDNQKCYFYPLDKIKITLEKLIINYQIEHIFFLDECFFINLKRVEKILEILKSYNITWEANIRANFLDKNYITDSQLKLLKDSGCSLLRFGGESGSPRILNKLMKEISINNILNAVSRCKKMGIACNISLMIGIPGEVRKDMEDTINLILKIKDIEPKTEIIGPQAFRAYPGNHFYNEIIENYMFKEPQNLRDWRESVLLFNMTYNNIIVTNFDDDTINYLQKLGFIVYNKKTITKEEIIKKADISGRRFSK